MPQEKKTCRFFCFSYPTPERKSAETVLNKIKNIRYAIVETQFLSWDCFSWKFFSVKLRPPPIRKQAKNRVRPRGMGNTMPPSSGKRNPLSSMPSNSVTRATPKLEQKPQQVRKYFFGVVLFIFSSRFLEMEEGQWAAPQVQNLRILTLDYLHSFNKCLFGTSNVPS